MSNTIVDLQEEYGNHLECLSKKDRASVASIIFLYLGSYDEPEQSLLSLMYQIDKHVISLSNEAVEFLGDLRNIYRRAELLDICSALLAGCR